jgi:ubiquinone/menaquinone biosynthesis C-methylase UbiE
MADDVSNWYREGYSECYYTGVVGKLYNFVHRYMEKPYSKKVNFSQVLELGAGDGVHFPHVKHKFDTYLATDIRPSAPDLTDARLKFELLDATDLTRFKDNTFDRLIATCLIVHLNNPFEALQEWRRVVKPGGVLTIYIAPEPGMLIRLVRKSIFWRKAARKGAKNPALLAYSEHINHYPGLITFVREIFKEDKIKISRFPFKYFSWNFAFFEIVHISII